jgi:hypothetical protein
MANPTIHTVKKGGVWQNIAEGSNRRIGSTYATKAEAQAAGKERARRNRTEHIIHNVKGDDRPAKQLRQRSTQPQWLIDRRDRSTGRDLTE